MQEVHASAVTLVVADNGAGMSQQLLHSGRAGHYGLTTMRERAEKLQGKLQIDTYQERGTTITLTFSTVGHA